MAKTAQDLYEEAVEAAKISYGADYRKVYPLSWYSLPRYSKKVWENRAMVNELAELRAEVSEMRNDKERLDWILNQKWTEDVLIDGILTFLFKGDEYPRSRTEIDAAMEDK